LQLQNEHVLTAVPFTETPELLIQDFLATVTEKVLLPLLHVETAHVPSATAPPPAKS